MSSSNHRAIALLVCGKTTGKTYAENGGYIDIFQRFLHASLDSLQPQKVPLENQNRRPRWQFSLDPYDVFQSQEYPDDAKIDDYDGIIITGSPAAAYENVEWVNKLVAFVKNVAHNKPRIKLIGICFGHQIIARALGGECVPNAGRWEIGPIPINLTDLGKQIFGVDTLVRSTPALPACLLSYYILTDVMRTPPSLAAHLTNAIPSSSELTAQTNNPL
ncbi:hypothetical protein EST38_g5286 [Candolleomyces aberdarensis]|uniref:Glutamine amidotransferase domain-containing protein n=1 Tax=Candolleomyces aberdarensis TaxID=2316362 RepID=A0A4V1Q421_9AGAR|nr:hypothetical protein EST38_g5286 [Candolleomyces aberdarensis]